MSETAEEQHESMDEPLNVWVYWEDVGHSPGYMGKLRECMRHHLGDRLKILDEKTIYDYLPAEEIEREWGFDRRHFTDGDWVVHKAEHFRLALVYYHGGIWVDADSIVFDNFDFWFEKVDEIGMVIRSEQLFGAVPYHPFIEECLERHRNQKHGTWGNPGNIKLYNHPDFPYYFYRIPKEEHESKIGVKWRTASTGSSLAVSDVVHDTQKYLTINTQQFSASIKTMSEDELMASDTLFKELICYSLAK